MSHTDLEAAVEAAWDARDTITPATKGPHRDAIAATLEVLDKGKLRVAERAQTANGLCANGPRKLYFWAFV